MITTDTHTISLKPYHILRPEKVRWYANIINGDVLASLKSDSMHKFLSLADQILVDQHITYEYHALTKEEYEKWLIYYREKMSENGFDIIATPEWYDSRRDAGFVIEGVFFYQDYPEQGIQRKLIATGIFTRKNDELATFAFKASDRVKIAKGDKGSIGAVADFFFLREMSKMGVKKISAGKSRNAFGVFNTLGYLNFSLRFGFVPSPEADSPLLSEVPLNDKGVVLFYGLKDNQLALYALKPKGSTQKFEHSVFATPELPYVEIEYDPELLTTP